jgi:hypothetical protein
VTFICVLNISLQAGGPSITQLESSQRMNFNVNLYKYVKTNAVGESLSEDKNSFIPKLIPLVTAARVYPGFNQ